MHQPDYRNKSGIMQMPWVFLHALKDYYDMPWMLSRHEHLKATFNITPPLIEQLALYYDEPARYDYFLSLWLRHPETLSEKERQWMVKICKSPPFDTMVAPLPTYARRYKKEQLDDRDLFDLQVLFMLSWCGVYLRQHDETVAALIEKGEFFSTSDKEALLSSLARFVRGIFDYYAKLHAEGRIAISTTPLNHPILPLLMDMNNAKAANPSTDIPKQHIPLEADAKEQVIRAQAMFRQTFGYDALGFWPAEGAVDPKSVALLHELGVSWIATDEAILFRSLGHSRRDELYHTYNYRGMYMGFRDHGLSDLVGFTYRFWEARKAADHFMGALHPIQKNNPEATVFVILDGENAWEYYHNNAFDFFDALYRDISNTSWCHTVHMDELIKGSARPLERLAAGSWIHGEFNTWVGHHEKTRGWELIFMAKRDYEHHKSDLSAAQSEAITAHFLAAECSDWFWWYGDDHYTDFGAEFDALFRSHLIDIYDLMGIAAPSDLFEPIIKNKSAQDFWLKPQSPISPSINGRHDTFFEWVGCGVLDETKLFSTMDKVRGPIHKIYYGQDHLHLYFAFEAEMQNLCGNDSLRIIIEPTGFDEHVKLHGEYSFEALDIKIACDRWLEMRLDVSRLEELRLQIRFELFSGMQVVQTLPGFGELEIDLSSDYSENWFV
ncbi:MAG: glycoside hydrolase [Campylobacterales bacterium]|nr:glycoside hydrolase [Campylobacterales bacterium]